MQVHRCAQKRIKLTRGNTLDRKEYSTLTVNMCRKKKQMCKVKLVDDSEMLSQLTSKGGHDRFLGEGVNRRAMLIPFQLGLGRGDVAKILSMLGLHGSNSMARNFSHNSKEIMAAIQDECDKIIPDGLKNEIIETLKCKKR